MKLNVFQRSLAIAGVFLLVLLFAGCPYSSSVPIDEGSVSIPHGLAGKWYKTSDEESEYPTYFEFQIEDKTHAKALKYEFSSNDSIYESITYYLTFSDVGGEVFMNAMEEGGTSYYLYKFVFDEKNKEITTYEVTDYIKETFASSDELKKFILKNKGASYFFTNTVESYVMK